MKPIENKCTQIMWKVATSSVSLRTNGPKGVIRWVNVQQRHPQIRIHTQKQSQSQTQSQPQTQSFPTTNPQNALLTLSMYTIHMPQLAPCMTQGKLQSWEKIVKARVNAAELIMRVQTDELIESSVEAKKRHDASQVTINNMLVESHDEGILVHQFVQPDNNKDIPTGKLLGLICDEEELPTYHQHRQAINNWCSSHINTEQKYDSNINIPLPSSMTTLAIHTSPVLWQAYTS